jgi:general secretion pathway protein G
MKKCSYCGRENADDAERCRECGTQEFTTSLALPETELQRKLRRTDVLFRLLISAFVWLAVTGLSLCVAWQNAGDAPANLEQWRTQYDLRRMYQSITQYQQEFHASPNSLAQLLAMTNGVPPVEERYLSFDGWKRPFLFASDGTNCLITSLGRDGKPGGRGLDCDLTNKDWRPKSSFPTFHQFLFEMPRTGGMTMSCLLCGGLAFFLCFFKARKPELTLPGFVLAGFRLGATILGAFIVAVIISALHIPSGH